MTIKNTLTRCMSLLISSPPFFFFLVILCFLNPFFFSFPPPCVETVTFLWGVDFVSTSGVCLTSKCNQRKKEKKKKKATRLISTRLRRSRRIWFWSILSPHPSCSSSLVVVSSALSSVASCQLSSCASSLSPVTKSLVPYVFFYVFLCYLHELARRGVFSVFSPLLFFSSSLGWLCAVECSSCVFFFSLPVSLFLSLLCRGCAVPDGWGPQTDPSAARGDGWYSELKGLLAVRHSTLCKNSVARSRNRILAYFNFSFSTRKTSYCCNFCISVRRRWCSGKPARPWHRFVPVGSTRRTW